MLFALTELLLCLTPGPAVLLVVSQGVRLGCRASVAGNIGVLSGNAAYFLLSALGLGGCCSPRLRCSRSSNGSAPPTWCSSASACCSPVSGTPRGEAGAPRLPSQTAGGCSRRASSRRRRTPRRSSSSQPCYRSSSDPKAAWPFSSRSSASRRSWWSSSSCWPTGGSPRGARGWTAGAPPPSSSGPAAPCSSSPGSGSPRPTAARGCRELGHETARPPAVDGTQQVRPP